MNSAAISVVLTVLADVLLTPTSYGLSVPSFADTGECADSKLIENFNFEQVRQREERQTAILPRVVVN